MDELIEHCHKIRKICHTRSAVDSPRDDCFGMIFNQTTVACELLHYYSVLWEKPAKDTLTDEEVALIRLQNSQRCVQATKSLFIGAISSIEYNIRKAVSLCQSHPLKDTVDRKERLIDCLDAVLSKLPPDIRSSMAGFRKMVRDVPPFDSFRRILDQSHRLGYLTESEYNLWTFMVEARNCCVHNNAIVNQNRQLRVANREFVMRKGVMLNAELDFFTLLLLEALPSLESWFECLRRAGLTQDDGTSPGASRRSSPLDRAPNR